MQNLQVRTKNGGTATLKPAVIEEFKAKLSGQLLRSGDDGYDDARKIWNGMIDKRPGLIARCREASDIVQAVDFARQNDLLVAVRGGGHNIAGNAVCDGGIMIDLSLMKSVKVDPKTRTAKAEPGATLGDFDREVQRHGLATPVGINSTTGLAGLTLGGGFGWLSRKYGLSIDNLRSVELVTADAKSVQASGVENRDLFWGIRGGGGNFGVVTSFEFRLQKVGPEVLSGLIFYPFEQAESVLEKYREFVAVAPEDLTVWVVLRKAPPLPFLPKDVHGKEVLILALLYAGDVSKGQQAIQPLKNFAKPIAEAVAPQPYTAFQSAFDPLLAPGARNYWKSHDFSKLSDGAIAALLNYTGKLPSPQCEIFVGQLGGAVSRVAADATAYTHRDAMFVLNVHGRWEDPAQDSEGIGWARELFKATAPYSTGGVYVNFLTQDEQDRVRAAYGSNYDRLVALKNKYDPGNLFRLNQNIKPTA